MKVLSTRILALALLAASMLVANSPAQEVPPETAFDANQVAGDDVDLGIPEELQDAAFDQYIDMAILREGWNRLDAAALADAGLQLAEGERILFRSHRAVTADQVLAAAARVAGEKRDTATLGRLVKAAKSLGKNDLATMASAAQKLASQGRSATPGPTVSLDELSPVDLSFYKAGVEGIEAARIRGDRTDLDEFTSDLAKDETLPKEIKTHLTRLADGASSSIVSASKEQSETLDKLLNPSRTIGVWSVANAIAQSYGRSGPSAYVRVRLSGGTPRTVYFGKTRTFSASLAQRRLQVQRSDGTWHGPLVYAGNYRAISIYGVYYIISFP